MVSIKNYENFCIWVHWNGEVILTKVSSVTTPNVVILTSDAASDIFFSKMTAFSCQCNGWQCFPEVSMLTMIYWDSNISVKPDHIPILLLSCAVQTFFVLGHIIICQGGANLRQDSTIWNNNSLWPSDAIWQHRYGSTLTQVMACCLKTPSHYLNQCWLTSEVQGHSSEGNFMWDTSSIIH